MSELAEKRFPFGLWHALAFGLGFFYIPLIFVILGPASQILSSFPRSKDIDAQMAVLAIEGAIFRSLPAIVYFGLYLFSSIRGRQSAKSGHQAPKISLLLLALLSQAALIVFGIATFIIVVIVFGFSSWLNWGAAIA